MINGYRQIRECTESIVHRYPLTSQIRILAKPLHLLVYGIRISHENPVLPWKEEPSG